MKQFKLVKHALDSAIGLINKGAAPTEALEKISRELDLNHNYIQRTGEALNVALTFNHFKTANCRADDFPISDIEKVTKTIFGDKELKKTTKRAMFAPLEASEIDYNTRLTNPTFKAAAAKMVDSRDAVESFPTSFKGIYKKASDYISRLEREVDVILTDKVAADGYIEGAFNSLTTAFKKTAASRVSFADFETRNFSVHGEKAVPYLDLLYKAAGIDEPRGVHKLRKLAGDEQEYVYALFDSFMKCAEENSSRAEEARAAEEFLGLCRAKFKTATASLHQPIKASVDEGCVELADKIGEYLEKTAGKMTTDVLTTLISDFRGVGAKKKTHAFSNTDADNRERTHLLQDLIMTDPILSSQDPRKILAAYQQILRLAPQLAKEKEVVRSMLRQLTATQALGTLEANQLVEANTNLLKQHQIWNSSEDEGGKKK